MEDNLQDLEYAISDVGYWRWWTRTTDAFQVEFGWVMLNIPSEKSSEPPSHMIALRFEMPHCVVALSRDREGPDIPADWFAKLGNDQIDPLNVSHEEFTLRNTTSLRAMIKAAKRREYVIGDQSALSGDARCLLAFWAGNAGLAVLADRMTIHTHRGKLEFAQIHESHAQWWAYWKEYWRRKEGPDPMPSDSLCEITIPAGT